MKSKKNYNSLLIEALGQKPIAFNPLLAKLANSAAAGLFLSQLLFWSGKGHEEWIYKTIHEVKEETTLTRSEQDRAIRIWRSLGVLKVVLRGIPRKRYFYVEKVILEELLERTRNARLPQHSAHKFAGFDKPRSKPEHATTESTSKNTNIDLSLQETGRTTGNNKHDLRL